MECSIFETGDITYMAEPIPPRSCIAGGLIRTLTYSH
jgi:hypothetical protein